MTTPLADELRKSLERAIKNVQKQRRAVGARGVTPELTDALEAALSEELEAEEDATV